MYYKIANLIIEMNPCYEPLRSQCINYLYDEYTNEKVDLVIKNNEKILNNYKQMYSNLSIGECEYMLYGSLFYNELIKNNGIMLHSSCVVLDGKAYLFSAPSGTGKSTHTSLWLKTFENAKILNDDKPAILIINNKCFACGTPFSGKTNLNINEIYPIQGIAFLKRSNKNFINKIENKTAIFNILNQTLRPDDEENYDKLFKIIDSIVCNISIFDFGCNISEDAVYTSYNAMNKL